MATLFISDLHLEECRPAITTLFLSFLRQYAASADALYILGDLFEAWIGDDERSELNKQVMKALRDLTDMGVPVYFMHGNRDFLIGKQFIKKTGCHLLPDPSVIKLYGQPVLLMHGDTLCTTDTHYLNFRKKVRNPLYQSLFLALPLSLRGYLAQRIRHASKRHTSLAPTTIMDVTPEAVTHQMTQHQVTLLIHGHTHRPQIHQLDQGQRVVLPAWETAGGMLVYNKQHELRFEIL